MYATLPRMNRGPLVYTLPLLGLLLSAGCAEDAAAGDAGTSDAALPSDADAAVDAAVGRAMLESFMACACADCAPEHAACFEDSTGGCARMTDCYLQQGCEGTADCYVGDTCRTLIDRFGVTSASAQSAMALWSCFGGTGCQPPAAHGGAKLLACP